MPTFEWPCKECGGTYKLTLVGWDKPMQHHQPRSCSQKGGDCRDLAEATALTFKPKPKQDNKGSTMDPSDISIGPRRPNKSK